MFRNAGKLPARILSFPILRTLHVWFDLTISVYNNLNLLQKTKEHKYQYQSTWFS